MKNFSELLATDISISINVKIEPIVNNGEPTAWIIINQHTVYHNRLSSMISVTVDVPLLAPIDIEIGMSGKTHSKHAETAVIIQSICIDNFEIVPNYTQLACYQNEQNFDSPTSYLGFNGAWRLCIDEPFYRWHHRVTGQGWLLEPVFKNTTLKKVDRKIP